MHARVKEDNPLYRDPVFREFFDLPKQLEKEVQATGSGVIVEAERGYVLTAKPKQLLGQFADSTVRSIPRSGIGEILPSPKTDESTRRFDDQANDL